MNIRKLIIWFTGFLLVTHLGFKVAGHSVNIGKDLIGFNLIALACAVIAATAPKINSRAANLIVALAIIIWTAGSFVSALMAFEFIKLNSAITDSCYIVFYPFLLLGVIIANSAKLKFGAVELLDSAIISLGSASVFAALLFNPLLGFDEPNNFSLFLRIFYICADIVLLIFTLLIAINSKLQLRTILLSAGLVAFVISDLYFLKTQVAGNYEFGQISDDGWLVGLFLLAIGMNAVDLREKAQPRTLNIFTGIALISSASLLGLAALHPGHFPNFILIPSFITIIIAFIRMGLAIQEARAASSERLLARTDELTGLANRRYFLKTLTETETGFLLIVDLNAFKSVNDNFGHDVGDKVLKQVAQRFNRVIDSNSIIARLGGDEFGVITTADEDSTEELVQFLLATLSYPVVIQTVPFQIGASIGIAKFWPDQDCSERLRQADLAMYRAKNRSRNSAIEMAKNNNQIKIDGSSGKPGQISSSTWEKFEVSMDEKFFENRL